MAYPGCEPQYGLVRRAKQVLKAKAKTPCSSAHICRRQKRHLNCLHLPAPASQMNEAVGADISGLDLQELGHRDRWARVLNLSRHRDL